MLDPNTFPPCCDLRENHLITQCRTVARYFATITDRANAANTFTGYADSAPAALAAAVDALGLSPETFTLAPLPNGVLSVESHTPTLRANVGVIN